MKKVIYPGTFDPLTKGHLDIIERASKVFDEVIVVILHNDLKDSLFSVEKREQFICENIKHLVNVRCDKDENLTVAYARKVGASGIIRGVRSVKDYEYEEELASANRYLDESIETLLLFTNSQYSFVSSSMIKEMAKYHQDVSAFVPDNVSQALKEEYR